MYVKGSGPAFEVTVIEEIIVINNHSNCQINRDRRECIINWLI